MTGGAARVERDVVRVAGPDAIAFLHGQLSQDVEALAVGASAWSFLLQPQGKVDAWLRVTRVAADAAVVDVDGGWGDPVVERLARFKLRTKADIERLPWQCVAVRGDAVAAVSDAPPGGIIADAVWPGVAGVDLLGPDVPLPAGVPELAAAQLDALRIEAGVPAMGREITTATIPAEVGVVERSVSFTKGCYTGQELVARIDSRGGHVPRRMRGVVVGDASVPPVGATLTVGGREVGTLTSVARSERLGTAVALALVRREVDPPVSADVTWDGGRGVAQIRDLPLVG